MRVYLRYSDGVTSMSNVAPRTMYDDTVYTDIPWYQWQVYQVYLWFDRKVGRWMSRLDNRAYAEMEARKDGGK